MFLFTYPTYAEVSAMLTFWRGMSVPISGTSRANTKLPERGEFKGTFFKSREITREKDMDLCHTQSYHDHDTVESTLWCLHCNNFHPQRILCTLCGSELFETNRLLSMMEGKIIWSHKDDTKCDDPNPQFKGR